MTESSAVDSESTAETDSALRRISRFRAVTVHLLKSALLPILVAKYLIFVLLHFTSPGVFAAAVLWFGTTLTVNVLAVNRSLSRIRRKFTFESPERCIRPSIIGFALCGLLSMLVDIAVISNANSRQGPAFLLLTAFVIGLGVFAYQSTVTRRAFAGDSEPETDPVKPSASFDELVFIVSDLAIIVVVIAALIAMM